MTKEDLIRYAFYGASHEMQSWKDRDSEIAKFCYKEASNMYNLLCSIIDGSETIESAFMNEVK